MYETISSVILEFTIRISDRISRILCWHSKLKCVLMSDFDKFMFKLTGVSKLNT